ASRGMGDSSAARTASASDNCAAAASGARGMATGVSMNRAVSGWVVFDGRALFVVSGGGQEGFQPVECIQRLPRSQPVRVDVVESATQLILWRRFIRIISIWGSGRREQG